MITQRLALGSDIVPLNRRSNDGNDKKAVSVRANATKSVHDAVKAKTSLQPKCLTSTEISNPVRLLRALFARNEVGIPIASSERFQRPAKEVMEAYDNETCRAVRKGDMDKIISLHKGGRSLNASNQFGESLLHMACRRGDKAVVQFMLKEARVRTDVRDDMGRNVFHDACWTSKPNLDVMDVLLESVSPQLLLATDVRGHSPFDCARKKHWGEWCKYLKDREDLLQRRLAIVSSIGQ